MVYRTDLITDPDVLGVVDAQLAVKVARWPSMTPGRLAAQIDKIVDSADADAVRRRHQRQPDREVWFVDDDDGISQIDGSLFSPDAHALDKRLTRWRPRCASMIRAAARSAALTRWGRWPPGRIGWAVAAGDPSVAPQKAPPHHRW